ncbi:hypothetical protein SADUNF_Sadunf03G0083100 [Salix dunnii]|uniref:Uncharacterized protein n=1 Tax=Salix dunnii TaxID=1413687 RepID=A0A835N3D5_9ROSI|nr:hypothetical protein SADUNF_Sadunf03G0083100 [Salix dunnii]
MYRKLEGRVVRESGGGLEVLELLKIEGHDIAFILNEAECSIPVKKPESEVDRDRIEWRFSTLILSSTVQITPELVNRFANDGDKLKKKAKKTIPKTRRETPLLKGKVNEKQLHDNSETHKRIASPGWPVQPPLYLPITQPVHPENAELDAIRSVIQESERVLEKFQKQEDNMVQQVTERAKDLRDKEFKLPYQKPMPCLVDYNACRACYKEHADDILKCAPLTKSYYECVRRAKQQRNSADK